MVRPLRNGLQLSKSKQKEEEWIADGFFKRVLLD
jgi:hypothetical protein